jgi:hypothetical protein
MLGGDYPRASSTGSRGRTGRSRMSYNSSSNGSRPKSVNSNTSDPRRPNPHKFYAASCNSSGDLAAQQRLDDQEDHDFQFRPESTKSESLPSSSAASLPQKPAIFTGRPTIETRNSNVSLAAPSSSSTSSFKSDRPSIPAPTFNTAQPPSVEAIPEHTSSPVPTPRDGSPVTPLTQQAQNEPTMDIAANLAKMSVANPGSEAPKFTTRSAKRASKPPMDAFLAGEAQELQLPDDDEGEENQAPSDLPFCGWKGQKQQSSHRAIDRVVSGIEQRPDSSRSRLGLKASMVVRTEATPWGSSYEAHTPPPLSPMSTSTRTSGGPLTPRTFLSKSFAGSLRSTRS